MAAARVLIVEDEGVVALDLRTRFESMGHRVVAWLTSGEEAVARALQGDVDLVVLDITLKGKVNGIDAARTLRASTHLVPILFLTAHAGLVTPEMAGRLAPCACLAKPFDGRALREAILELLP